MKQTGTPAPSARPSKPRPPRQGFRKVQPYSTLAGAKAALDNGGRFWNLFTTAGDSHITKAELARAAGLRWNEANCFLFFDMALAKLSPDERAEVVAMLTPKQARRYREHGPRTLPPAAAARLPAKSLVITEGVPRFLQEIIVLEQGVIMVGKVMVPVTHRRPFALYELRDVASGLVSGVRLAVAHKEGRLAEVPIRIGGYLWEHRVAKDKGETKALLFLPCYYTPLD